VETRSCGICGTDLHIIEGFGYVPRLPHIPGHEPSGVVSAVGAEAAGFREGDRVVPHLFLRCGECEYCRSGRESMCARVLGIIGVTVDGAFAEYFKAPARNLFKIPDTVSFDEGGLLADAVVTAVHAVKDRANARKGDLVAVIGVGGVGQVIVQLLKNVGARVVAISRSDQKLSIARELGSDMVIRGGDTNLSREVRQLGANGVDVVIDCVGTEESMRDSLACVKRCGRIVMVGEEKAFFPADTITIAQHELELVGSRNGTLENMKTGIELLSSGKVRPIISDVYPLDEVNGALDRVRKGAQGRVVVRVRS
jgi:D-arabinose 1-dehydrogenase-like Zn-dependent alcohol dehydrogenase